MKLGSANKAVMRNFILFFHILFHMAEKELITLNWNNIGFITCKPDAVYLNYEQEILSFLQQKGLQILACKYVTITPDLCRSLYWNENIDFTDKWWELESEFFHLGESLCVLVQGTPEAPYKSVSEWIDRKLKGDNKPESARNETIRSSFGAMNRIFNLFHSSDCTEATKREASLFFSAEKLRSLDQLSTRCLVKPKKERTLDIIDVYFRIKKHCIQASDMSPKVKRKYGDYLDEKKQHALNVSNSKKQVWLFKTLKEEYRLFYEDIHEDILLETITDYKYFTKIDFNALFRSFIETGLKLTKWELCLLKTTLFFAPSNF
jgi:nucleoside diphosphate kinase